jgi:hypothetical protein
MGNGMAGELFFNFGLTPPKSKSLRVFEDGSNLDLRRLIEKQISAELTDLVLGHLHFLNIKLNLLNIIALATKMVCGSNSVYPVESTKALIWGIFRRQAFT